MIEKFNNLYEKNLAVKIATVTIVVLLSVAIMLPLLKIAELFGVNIKGNSGLNFKVTFGNVFFFFLFGVCTIAIIWLAQKYIHKKPLSELGLRRKIWLPSIIGFIIGAIIFSSKYFILYLNGASITFTKVISEDVTLITYLGYYIYFFFGFIFWNSFIEEIGMRAYPIQKLKNHINPYIIFTIMGFIFTIGHFFLNDFSVVYFLSLFVYSYIFSLVYYYSNSIWFVIGIHSGSNWVAFSFFGKSNWKLGGLYNTEIIGGTSWINDFIYLIVLFIILLIIVFLNKKGVFRKYFPIQKNASNKLNEINY
jgi:membrane protease YdiL (CAAX protease family)